MINPVIHEFIKQETKKEKTRIARRNSERFKLSLNDYEMEIYNHLSWRGHNKEAVEDLLVVMERYLNYHFDELINIDQEEKFLDDACVQKFVHEVAQNRRYKPYATQDMLLALRQTIRLIKGHEEMFRKKVLDLGYKFPKDEEAYICHLQVFRQGC